jgi:hypothetical protein
MTQKTRHWIVWDDGRQPTVDQFAHVVKSLETLNLTTSSDLLFHTVEMECTPGFDVLVYSEPSSDLLCACFVSDEDMVEVPL